MDSNQADRIQQASDYLQQARQHAGYTQAKLAEMMGISASAIGVYESGSRAPYPMYIYKAAEACSFDPDEVFALLGRVPPDLIERIGKDLGSIRAVRRCLKGRK